MTNIDSWLASTRANFQLAFKNAINERTKGTPESLKSAISYVTSNSGKNLRPLLCLASAHAFDVPQDRVLPFALAIEAVHIYSLVHDDLPAMDDDDMRRGVPTCHKQYDEATAILVGDALQTLAFEILLTANLPPTLAIKAMTELALAAGQKGMVAGQMLDIEATGTHTTLTLQQLDDLHQLKTGAMLRACVRAGVLFQPTLQGTLYEDISDIGSLLGLAFQIKDDILDVTSSSETLGKPANSDTLLKKTTYPSLIGLDAAQTRLRALYQEAIEKILKLPGDTLFLQGLAKMIIEREY